MGDITQMALSILYLPWSVASGKLFPHQLAWSKESLLSLPRRPFVRWLHILSRWHLILSITALNRTLFSAVKWLNAVWMLGPHLVALFGGILEMCGLGGKGRFQDEVLEGFLGFQAPAGALASQCVKIWVISITVYVTMNFTMCPCQLKIHHAVPMLD